MSSTDAISIHPTIKLIFPMEDLAVDGLDSNVHKEEIDPDTAWHFYSHSIRRNPTNLTLHTHRVFFAMRHKDAVLLPGSLNDLFFVLKDAGKQLRIRLLKAAMPYLSKQDTLYFAMWIKVGIKNGMGYQWVNGSVLSDGLYGPDQMLITMKKSEYTGVEASPIEKARERMEHGKLESAQQILNEAIAKDLGNTKIVEELEYLNTYIKSREIQPAKPQPKLGFGSTLLKLKDKILATTLASTTASDTGR